MEWSDLVNKEVTKGVKEDKKAFKGWQLHAFSP